MGPHLPCLLTWELDGPVHVCVYVIYVCVRVHVFERAHVYVIYVCACV